MNLAPIVLFVYNRPWHTLQTLEALMANGLAKISDLYIYCDGPKEMASAEDIKKIAEVKKVIREKKWCGKVEIKERENNIGLANSVINGVTEVIEKHDKVIVLEDDIITGKYFLNYMNDGLNTYENDKEVFGISGYKYPSVAEAKMNTYFLPIACSWSYATWSDRWNKVDFDGNTLLEIIHANSLKGKMNFGGYPFYEMLKAQVAGNNNSWAIRFYASMFLNNGLFLYPNESLVENVGFDNSGTNCGSDDFFSNIKIIDKQVVVEKQVVSLNKGTVKLFKKSFELQNKKKSGLISNFKRTVKKGIKQISNKTKL